MAGYKYFVILTDIGKQKLAQAIATESPLDFTEMAVGDSNGTSYNPTPDMTALKHETYRATISNVSIDEVDRNIMIFQLVVPSSSGGYYIREAGLFSSDGSLIAIARTAEQYKPQLSEGAGASIDINMRIAISSEAQIYINVPESDSYATQNYVQEEFKKHKADENPHSIYTEAIENLKNNKANKTHNHELSSLNGVLPVNKGGTGTDNAFNFQNFMSISNIFSKFGMGESPSLQVFFEKLPNFCSFTSLVQGGTINAPFGGLITVIKFDNNSGYIKLNRFNTVSTYNEWTEAIAVMQGGKASSWKTIRDVNGFYTDCIARPNKVVMLSSDSAYEPNYQVGDIIYRYSKAGSNTNIFVPNSGTWIVECLMIFDRNGVPRVELGGSGIYEGGAKLDTNNDFNFRYRLTKIK